MEAWAVVFILAILVEAVLQAIKGGVPEEAKTPAWLWPAVGAALGVVLCVAADVDAFGLLGVTLGVPHLGATLTGIIISRGASFVHDLWGKVNGDKVTE